jgi:S1-C subfamily serine protease
MEYWEFILPLVEERYFKQQDIALGTVKGVYITNVMNKSAAAEAGLKEGDIIQSIDGIQLSSSTEFSERIASIDLTTYNQIKLFA